MPGAGPSVKLPRFEKRLKNNEFPATMSSVDPRAFVILVASVAWVALVVWVAWVALVAWVM